MPLNRGPTVYTASANITPAHLHGEICIVLPRERSDIEVAGYKQEKCSHSVFTPKSHTNTQNMTDTMTDTVPPTHSLSNIHSLSTLPLSFSLIISWMFG
eukprot:sb/3478769/